MTQVRWRVSLATLSRAAALLCLVGGRTALAQGAEEGLEPFEGVGDAVWSDNLGLVREAGEHPAEGAPVDGGTDVALPGAGMIVPSMGEEKVGYCVKGAGPLVAATPAYRTDNRGPWGIIGGARMRCEAPRTMTSMFVPWGHLAAWFGGFPGEETLVLGGDLRVGFDFHPARWHSLGVGALVEYEFDKFISVEEDNSSTTARSPEWSYFANGVGFGGHVIYRTAESPGSPPVFFADLAVLERVAFAGRGSSFFFDLTLGVGGKLRLLVFADVPVGGDYYQGARIGLGMGGYY